MPTGVYVRSSKLKKQMSAKMKRLWKIPKIREKFTEAAIGRPGYWTGKKRDKAVCNAISKARCGKTLSKKHRERIGAGNRLGRKIVHGYVFIYEPKHKKADHYGYVREHRDLIEREIGRLLETFEEVHHVNQNRKDNRLCNLMAFSSKKAHKDFEAGKSVDPEKIIFDGRNL